MGLFTVIKKGAIGGYKTTKKGGKSAPSKFAVSNPSSKAGMQKKQTRDVGSKKDRIGDTVEETMKGIAFVGAPTVAVADTITINKKKKAKNTGKPKGKAKSIILGSSSKAGMSKKGKK